MTEPTPRRSSSPRVAGRGTAVAHAALIVLLALAVGIGLALLRFSLAPAVPGSLAFSLAALAVVGLVPRVFPRESRDHTIALSAAALAGTAPFVAFCCSVALTVPTWDSRPLEGLGPIVQAFITMFCLVVGPGVAFVLGLPVGLGAGPNRRAFVRFLAGLVLLGAAVITPLAAVRRARFPDPDGYFPSLPRVPVIETGACGEARCVRCSDDHDGRRLSVVGAGERDLGDFLAPCARVEARYDAGREVLLIAGDVDRGRTLHAWASVQSYALSGPGPVAEHLDELRGVLAPPLSWVVESGLGVGLAIAALLVARRRDREIVDVAAADARATARASVAFAAVVLLSTPLAMAAWKRLV